jgi:hypothetical protein
VKRALRSACLGAACWVLAIGRPCAAQTFTPSTLLLSPAPGHVFVEVEAAWTRPGAFVSAEGAHNDFPGSLGFGVALLRASYSPLPHLAGGVELPFRSYRYHPDDFEAASGDSGVQGIGVFADWRPSGPAARLSCEARVEVFFAFDGHANPLSVSDGVNRYLVAFQVLSPSRGGVLPGWRLDAQTRVEFEHGPNSETEDQYVEWDLVGHAGARLAKVGPAELLLLAVSGYRRATSARQEGNIFGTSESQNALAGALLGLSWPDQASGPGPSIELSATREIGIKNSLDGWRGALTLRHAF